jgi:hypothetical protein
MSKSPTVLLCPHCQSRVLVDETKGRQSLACSCPVPSHEEAWPKAESDQIRVDEKTEIPQPVQNKKRGSPVRWFVAAAIVLLAGGVAAFAFQRDAASPKHVSRLNAEAVAEQKPRVAEVHKAVPVAADVEPTTPHTLPPLPERKTYAPKFDYSIPEYMGVPEAELTGGGKGGGWVPNSLPVYYTTKTGPGILMPRPFFINSSGKINNVPVPHTSIPHGGGFSSHGFSAPPARRR